MTIPHPLDRPVWAALSDRQSGLSLGGARARCMIADYGPFGAAADASPASLAALAGLFPPGGNVWTFEAADFPQPPDTIAVRCSPGTQMVAAALTPATTPAFEIVQLSEADAPAMLALATLTEPGPFMPLTHRLGSFVGVKHRGTLVAMAGERLRPPGHTEVSGVCTHPDHRSRGYAGALMRVVAGRILARGETPILHAYASNTGAIAMYATLGFEVRRTIMLTVLAGVAEGLGTPASTRR